MPDLLILAAHCQ